MLKSERFKGYGIFERLGKSPSTDLTSYSQIFLWLLFIGFIARKYQLPRGKP